MYKKEVTTRRSLAAKRPSRRCCATTDPPARTHTYSETGVCDPPSALTHVRGSNGRRNCEVIPAALVAEASPPSPALNSRSWQVPAFACTGREKECLKGLASPHIH